jgi:hypothetical protein
MSDTTREGGTLSWRLAAATGACYVVLAELLYRFAWPSHLPLSQQYGGAAVLTLLAASIYTLTTGRFARRAGAQWHSLTALQATIPAAGGALTYLVVVGMRLSWGAACNQCQPVAVIVFGTAAAGMVAALAAVPIGWIARRLPPNKRLKLTARVD